MINVQMSGLDEIIDRLQESPEVFRDARSREIGKSTRLNSSH